ncbi:MAG: hypothetical protein ACQETH_00455 [Candidatus Rifleibacteriota bacterium]
MIINRIESVLNIRAGEWKETGFFWFFIFFNWYALGLGDATSDSLFIKRVGYEQLPVMFIICALAAIPLSLALTFLQGKREKRQVTLVGGVVSAILIFLCIQLVLKAQDFIFLNFSFYCLYLIANTMQFVMPVIFSVLIGTQFNSLKGKRLVPLIFTGVVAGRIAAGTSLAWLADQYALPVILWYWLFIHVLGFLVFAVGSKSFLKPQIKTFISQHSQRKKTPLLEKIKKFLTSLFESRLVLYLVCASVFSTIAFYLAEFQCAEIFNRHFADENSLAQFYGYFIVFSSLLAFLFQSLITGNLIQRLGIGNTNFIFPVLVTTGFSGTLFSFSLSSGIWLKFVNGGLSDALFQPVNNLFYNALPVKEKARIITINEGVLLPLGTVFTGILLLYANSYPQLVKTLPVFVGVAWIILSVLMKKPYRDGLLKLLKSSELDFKSRSDLKKLSLDQNTMQFLLDRLERADTETACLIVQLIITNGDPVNRKKLFNTIKNYVAGKKAEILNKAILPVDQLSMKFLFDCIDENNQLLNKMALKSLTRFPASAALRERVKPFLNGEDFECQRLAAVILARIGDLDQMVQSLKILQASINSSDEDELIKGVEVLGYTGDERFWVNLKPFINSRDTAIRKAAAQAIEKVVSNAETDELYDVISSMISDSNREIRFTGLKILQRLTEPKWFYLVVEGLSDSSPRNRKKAQDILVSHYDDMFSQLITVLESPETSLHAKAVVGGILAVSQDSSIRDYLHLYGQKIIQELYEYKVEEYILMRDFGSEKTIYLRMLLNEKAWALTRLIVCLVAPEQSREARDLFKSLYSTDEELISNAIEVLQNMGERQLVYHIIPILEQISLQHIAAYGFKVFGIQNKEAKIIIGKYLNHNNILFKEAAVFTAAYLGISEFIPVVKNIKMMPAVNHSLKETCEWALSRLEISPVEVRR